MFRALLFAVGLLLLIPVTSAAPVPAGPKGGETVPLATAKLLNYRKVQKELKMTAEQRINMVDALEDIEEEYEKKLLALDKLPNAPDEAFQKVEKDRLKAVEKLMTTTAEKVLSPAQRTRLRQVNLRLQGPAAFADPVVQKALQLDDDAKKAADALADRTKWQAASYIKTLGDDEEDKVRAEVLAFRKDGLKEFTALLTPAQKDTWKAMVGNPVKSFDVDQLWLKVVEDEDLEMPD